MKTQYKRLAARLCAFVIVALFVCGCGGGGGGGGSTPSPTPTPVPVQPPVNPPNTPFDVRGRVLLNGVGQAGAIVTATARDANAVTPSDRTTSGAGGFYSFFLGAGNYTIRATLGARAVERIVTVPPGGQTVDNFDLNL